ncbi:MAG: hypothetical protein GEV03_16330 [Streptosporangiales bacterium]|nr:hypothetical protein [Streptosporangiales bacterium]
MGRPFGDHDEWSQAPSDVTEFLEYAEKLGWGDGLPLVPPTAAAITAMLDAAGLDADESLGVMPPAEGLVTAAKVAANAVLAGCTPQAFPVVVAAVQAMLEPRFNLNGVQSTTHPVAPLVIVHGPVVERVGFNARAGTFGPGCRANATVGRAIRLCLLNIGGARPGEGDRSTQGQPSKYTHCIAENAAESPWPSYAVEGAGLSPSDGAVTVFGGENPHNVNDHVSTGAVGILSTVASNVAVLGANNAHYSGGEFFVVLGPEHAATAAGSGFRRRDVQMWLYEKARLSLGELKRGGMWGMQAWPAWKDSETDDGVRLPLVDSPDDFRVLVAGGPGKHSSVLPSFGATRSVTRRVAVADGQPRGTRGT